MTTIAARPTRCAPASPPRTTCRARPADVKLLAVSKTWPAEAVREPPPPPGSAFGENYVQEGVDKVEALRALGSNGISSARCRATRRARWRTPSTGCMASTA